MPYRVMTTRSSCNRKNKEDPIMTLKHWSAALLSMFLLTACGGGGSGGGGGGGSSPDNTSSSGESSGTSGNSNQSAQTGEAARPGVYSGEITTSSGDTKVSIAVLGPDNRLVLFIEGGVYDRGSVSFDGSKMTGELKEFRTAAVESGSIEATMTSNSFSGTATSEDGTESKLAYQRLGSVSDEGADMDKIKGSWTEQKDGISTNFTVMSNGELDGSESDGCVFDGQVTIPDPQYNLYAVSFDGANCAGRPEASASERNAGSYQGFAYLTSSETNGNGLNLFADNDQAIVVFTGH
ncbi:hypothetical protein QQM79_10885 [Marinobacteraceae bacterium S3BR75-40.1]